MAAARGFTVLELLVVVTIIALSSGLTLLALRDGQQQRLEQEAVRLSALLEAARLESRSSGRPWTWAVAADTSSVDRVDFRFDGPPAGSRPSSSGSATAWPRQWLDEATRAEVIGAPRLILGPDPILPPQRVRLSLGPHQITLATDGLSPFAIDGAGTR